MHVRPAEEGDARSVAQVHVRSWQEASRGQVPESYLAGLSVDQREPIWQGILAQTAWPATGTLLLVKDEEVIGFAHISPTRDHHSRPNVGEITAIYLAPQHWGQGGGQLLIEGALSALREAGFDEATLWVLDTNERAQRFYRAGGWVADGAAKVDESRGFPLRELRYRRPLQPGLDACLC